MAKKVFDRAKYWAKTGYIPHQGQTQIHYTPARFKVVSNGRRWGKTFLGAKEIEPNAFCLSRVTGEPQLGWIVGPQYTDAEKEFRIVYDSLRKVGVDKSSIKFVNNPDNGSMHIVTNWGFELLGKSAKHPETLVGEGLDFVLMVEAGRHRRRTWGQYIRPALSDHRGWAGFTGVPEGKSEHSLLFEMWQRGQSTTKFKNWKSWRMPSWTNNVVFPGGRQDPEILEAEEDLTKDEFDRQYGAMFVDKVGAVMQEWDDEIHLKDLKYNPNWPLYGAVDYGFVNPFVWLWIQIDEWDNIYVIKEYRWTHKDTPEVALDLQSRDRALVGKTVAFYPDPAEPDDTVTLSKMLKVPSRGGTGGELKTRLALIRMALKERNTHLAYGHTDRKPKLFVDRENCKTLAWEMREGYRWPEHKSEVKSDSEHPLDKDNHGPEALGRFFRGYYGLPGETLTQRRTQVRKAVIG